MSENEISRHGAKETVPVSLSKSVFVLSNSLCGLSFSDDLVNHSSADLESAGGKPRAVEYNAPPNHFQMKP